MKPSSTASIDLDRFVPYRLSVLSNLVSGTIADAYRRRFGLGIPEWRVLAVLARFPGLSAAEVAERTRMDAVAVSRAVARLLADRRLQRTVSRQDRRRSVLSMSAGGAAVYRAVAPLALDYERNLLAALDAGDRATLERLLEVLTERARSMVDSGTPRSRPGGRTRPRRARRAR